MNLPVLSLVGERLRSAGTVSGRRVAADDAHLVRVLSEAGAEVNVPSAEVVIDCRTGVVRGATVSIATSEARCTNLFDNGQSVVNAVLDRTNLLAADKDAVVVGYDRGVALRLRGLGARVTVCETDPFAALEAYRDGFDVAPLVDACRTAQLVFGEAALEVLPDGALLAGGIDTEWLHEHAVEARAARDHVDEFVLDDGRSLFFVGGPESRPDETIDLALAVQALSAAYVLQQGHRLEAKVHGVPAEVDEEIARLKLESLGVRIDES